MFEWIFQIGKKFEGKWKGKGFIFIKKCNKKIIKKCIYTKLIIKKIDDFSYQIFIRNLIEKNYTGVELLGYINKETGILEFQNLHGSSQFYFDCGYLINSYNTYKKDCFTTGTIKLIIDEQPKPCPSIFSSLTSSSSTSYPMISSTSISSCECKKKHIK